MLRKFKVSAGKLGVTIRFDVEIESRRPDEVYDFTNIMRNGIIDMFRAAEFDYNRIHIIDNDDITS